MIGFTTLHLEIVPIIISRRDDFRDWPPTFVGAWKTTVSEHGIGNSQGLCLCVLT